MAQLVGHDDFDFFPRKIVEQRVRHNNAPRITPTDYGRVGLARLLSERPLEDAAYPLTGPPRQTIDSVLQVRIVNRFKFKKQRQQEHRSEIRHHDNERDKDDASVNPPEVRINTQ